MQSEMTRSTTLPLRPKNSPYLPRRPVFVTYLAYGASWAFVGAVGRFLAMLKSVVTPFSTARDAALGGVWQVPVVGIGMRVACCTEGSNGSR